MLSKPESGSSERHNLIPGAGEPLTLEMSLTAPSRRIAGRCLFCQTLPYRPRVQQSQQRAFAVQQPKRASNDESDGRANPVLEDWRRKNPASQAESQQPRQMMPQAGDLSASSIFEDDRRVQQQMKQLSESQDTSLNPKTAVARQERNPANMLRVLDPDPNSRERWERKKVIQMIRRGGRLNKEQMIKRTEREHMVRSHNMKTSIKKLGMLARQIAGKTLDDAITQMRFSKKKVAQEVLKQLEFARDEAVVTRGMGLGETEMGEDAENPSGTTPLLTGAVTAPSASSSDLISAPVTIQLKDGKRHTVTSPSTIYVEQAWVGRGPFGQLPDYRARGQVYIMRTPWTSLSVVLKEEKTRIRQFEEREAKRKEKMLGKGLWTHLPDRPVQWQRQWYTF